MRANHARTTGRDAKGLWGKAAGGARLRVGARRAHSLAIKPPGWGVQGGGGLWECKTAGGGTVGEGSA